MSSALSPLHGKDGIYRVVIHGNSGTGKTTLSNKLAEILQVPVIHLDEVYWRPGWIEAPDEEMIKELALQIDKSVQTGSGWIVDGNYERCTNRIMDFAATDIICLLNEPACFNHVELSLICLLGLDPPFYRYFPRTLIRTFRRILGLEDTCAPGCKESWIECFFSTNSILLWCLTNHFKVKRRYEERWKDDPVSIGGRWRRLGDIDEHAAFLDAVAKHVKTT
jgi:hypothetical protein